MALKPCKECGSSVSTLANICPKCGAPDPTEGTLVLKKKISKRSSKKNIEEKEEGSKKSLSGVILILVMFGLLSIPVFNWGKFGINKVKSVKNSNKIVKNTSSGPIRINFTCEGTGKTTGLYSPSSGDFIDEYTIDITKGKDTLLYFDTNDQFARTSFSGVKNLSSTPLTIKISHRNYKFSDEIFVKQYDASISLQSGKYTASTYTTFRNSSPYNRLTGRCYGIENISGYIK